MGLSASRLSTSTSKRNAPSSFPALSPGTRSTFVKRKRRRREADYLRAQALDWIGQVNGIGSARDVVPGGVAGDAEGVVDGGGEMLRRLRIGGRISAGGIGRPDYGAAAHAA